MSLDIARRVSQSLEKLKLEEPSRLKELLQGAMKVLNAEVTGVKLKIPNVGDFGVTSEKEKFTLAFGIGEITTKTKSDATLREKLNQYLGPQKSKLLEAINKELLEPAITKLKQQGKKGLVVIVDNLDRIDNRPKAWGRPQQEYLFVDQGEYLTKLNCHMVYTMPLALKFSNDYGTLTQRFLEDPSTASRKSKVKSQKSKGLKYKVFGCFRWLLYFRHAVLGYCRWFLYNGQMVALMK